MDERKNMTSQGDLKRINTMRQGNVGAIPSNFKTENKTPSREGARVRGEVKK